MGAEARRKKRTWLQGKFLAVNTGGGESVKLDIAYRSLQEKRRKGPPRGEVI